MQCAQHRYLDFSKIAMHLARGLRYGKRMLRREPIADCECPNSRRAAGSVTKRRWLSIEPEQ